MSKNPTPSRAKLIALLIEERAKIVAWRMSAFPRPVPFPVSDDHRDQARREIEAEVLTQSKGKS